MNRNSQISVTFSKRLKLLLVTTTGNLALCTNIYGSCKSPQLWCWERLKSSTDWKQASNWWIIFVQLFPLNQISWCWLSSSVSDQFWHCVRIITSHCSRPATETMKLTGWFCPFLLLLSILLLQIYSKSCWAFSFLSKVRQHWKYLSSSCWCFLLTQHYNLPFYMLLPATLTDTLNNKGCSLCCTVNNPVSSFNLCLLYVAAAGSSFLFCSVSFCFSLLRSHGASVSSLKSDFFFL